MGRNISFHLFLRSNGFRYIKVEGIADINPADFTGVVIYSNLPVTMRAQTENAKINRLMQNALWGQRGNFVDLPTDCPQRDERLGWTGDTQVFAGTACFQMDCYPFYKKFMTDMRADQRMYYNGDIPMFCPSLKGKAGPGGPAWADAATILPWRVYMAYGDMALLRTNYVMMRDYVETLLARDRAVGDTHILSEGFAFGDWLAQDGVTAQSLKGSTDETFIRTVYYWNSVRLTAMAASALDYQDDAKRYGKLMAEIRYAILDEFFSPKGRLSVDTQTGYVLALYFGLYREKNKVIAGLKTRLYYDSYQIKTGFVGTPLMLAALIDNGMVDEAYRTLMSEGCPGWLYAVNLGATTIWERWNSLLPDGTINGTEMNSLNHYAYGSVVEMLYSRIAGLQCEAPGWRRAVIAPALNYRLKKMSLVFDSPQGEYRVSFEIIDGSVALNVVIPNGASAKIFLPAHPDNLTVEVSSGNYAYHYTADASLCHPFSKECMVMDLLTDEDARNILSNNLPQIFIAANGENAEFQLWTPQKFAEIGLMGITKGQVDAADAEWRRICV